MNNSTFSEQLIKNYNITDGLNSMKMCKRYRSTNSPIDKFDWKIFYFHPKSNQYFCKELNKIYKVNSLLDIFK